MNSLPVHQAVPARKKSNKIWLIVGVVFLLCCLCSMVGVVGGYFYLQNNDMEIGEIGEIFETLVQPSQPNEVKSGEEIRCEGGGYAFKTIPDYDVVTWLDDAGYNLDSKDWDFNDPNFVTGEGPQIIISGFVHSNELTFEKYVKNGNRDMQLRLNATISGEPQVTVAGLQGAAFDYDYELPGAGMMKARDISVEVNSNQFFMIQCRSTVEKWDKTLADCEAVINSITFFEPAPQ